MAAAKGVDTGMIKSSKQGIFLQRKSVRYAPQTVQHQEVVMDTGAVRGISARATPPPTFRYTNSYRHPSHEKSWICQSFFIFQTASEMSLQQEPYLIPWFAGKEVNFYASSIASSDSSVIWPDHLNTISSTLTSSSCKACQAVWCGYETPKRASRNRRSGNLDVSTDAHRPYRLGCNLCQILTLRCKRFFIVTKYHALSSIESSGSRAPSTYDLVAAFVMDDPPKARYVRTCWPIEKLT
jgi:hypothetical protein